MFKKALVLSACLTLSSAAASAAPVFFLLGDHSDGALYQSTCTPVCDPNSAYGLRLDDLDTTFSVGDNLGGFGGAMFLTYDPDELSGGAFIFGEMDSNDELGDGENLFVQYQLTGLSSFGNGFRATGGNGTIAAADCDELCRALGLTGVQDDAGYAFYWDDDSFRDPLGADWVGRGWVKPGRIHGGGNGTVIVGLPQDQVAQVVSLNSTKPYNDWLVTGTPSPGPGGEEVPEPATVSLMIGGLALLVARNKFRR